MKTTWALAVALSALPAAWAAEPEPEKPVPPPTASDDVPAKPPLRGPDRAEALAQAYGVEAQTVRDLRERGLGWGEVEHALGIAAKADKPLSEVLALREEGLGWGQIAQRCGFTLGSVRSMRRVREEGAGERGRPERLKDALKPEKRVHEPRLPREPRGRGARPERAHGSGHGRK